LEFRRVLFRSPRQHQTPSYLSRRSSPNRHRHHILVGPSRPDRMDSKTTSAFEDAALNGPPRRSLDLPHIRDPQSPSPDTHTPIGNRRTSSLVDSQSHISATSSTTT